MDLLGRAVLTLLRISELSDITPRPPTPTGARLGVATRSRRDPISLAVGETYGKRRTKAFNPTPKGLNSTPSGSLRYSTYAFSSVGFTYG